ncbi:DUF4276 family protein [Amycolatopsis sp. cg5]|uniref:DUF4276 family protein n=1 Tax=Amycolatopsis sp. cg5 TaxID=3238802 RepID=UPI0035259E13
MRPLKTAIAVEGSSDETFFKVLVDRVLREIANVHCEPGFDVGTPMVFRRGPDTWKTLCEQLRAPAADFDLALFHYDGTTKPEREAKKSWEPMLREWERESAPGGRPLLLQLVPVREMESWALADLDEVNQLIGSTVCSSRVFEAAHLPQVERLSDPKRTLAEALRSGRQKRRSIHFHLEALAERVSLTKLLSVPSFRDWRDETIAGLDKLGFIESGGKA